MAHLKLPPLRERVGDILPLANYFIAKYAERSTKPILTLDKVAEKKLLTHTWPVNIRELENVIHLTLLICKTHVISGQDLHISNLLLKSQIASHRIEDIAAEELLVKTFERLFNEQSINIHQLVERALFHTAYEYSFHNQVHTAQLLGVSRNIVRAKLIEYGN